MSRFAITLALLAACAWALTEALRHGCPRLPRRQRWAVVWWLAAAAGAFHLAWEVSA